MEGAAGDLRRTDDLIGVVEGVATPQSLPGRRDVTPAPVTEIYGVEVAAGVAREAGPGTYMLYAMTL